MMKSRQTIKQWKYKRYFQFIRHASAKKVYNLLRAAFYWIKGDGILKSKPAFLRVEISRKCEVKCLYCLEPKENLFYPFEDYKTLIDKLQNYIFLVSLYEIGEPLENENIVDYIKYANSRNIGTIISTNLSISKPDTFWKNLVLSGLDRIVVAIDGITEAVYKQYRTNGNYELVISNLKKIIMFKEINKSHIQIEWQMIDLPWNKSQQNDARKYSKEIGCSEFRLIEEVTSIRRKYKFSDYIRKKNCKLSFFTFNVTAYNKVRPCTKIYNENVIVGDLSVNSFDDIWNGKEIQAIRNKGAIMNRPGCKTCHE
ncbi:MAG TPA: SPASM domain-containing protein [Bacteroidales bacterium]|nr:SPASM domain-containing protein [Bacteroidales bacterium]